MSQKPRDYQLEAKAGVEKEWQRVSSTLVVLPTGCGKTVLMADLILSAQPRRTLVLAHRKELIWQAKEKIEHWAGVEVEVEMGDHYAISNPLIYAPVVVSTVQTQGSNRGDRTRMSRFKPTDFDFVFFDECHHATARTYLNILNYYRQNPRCRFLGVTATPDRLDRKALGAVFQSVAYDYEILDAIEDGWLVPVEQQFVAVQADFSKIKTTAGDLNGSQLAAVMEAERPLHEVAGATIELAGAKRAIVFTVSVKQAEWLSAIFNRHRAGMANWVCGFTPEEARKQMLADFKAGKHQILCNCGVLTEGYDDWGVEVIAMARLTKSRQFYAQMAGRATRPVAGLVDPIPDETGRREAIEHSAKPSCLLIDFVGNSGRHKLMSGLNILGGRVSEDAIDRALKLARKSGCRVRTTDLLDEMEKKLRQERHDQKLREEAQRASLVAKVSLRTKHISPFAAFDLFPVKGGKATKTNISSGVSDLLMKQGINPEGLSYDQAMQLHREVMRRFRNGLCSLKQAEVLKRYYDVDTRHLSRREASRMLDTLKCNGWKPVPQNQSTLDLKVNDPAPQDQFTIKPGSKENSPFNE